MLRSVLLMIIIGTFPFYCLGFALWGTAPDPQARSQAQTATITALTGEPSWTPIGGDLTQTPTLTLIVPGVATTVSPLGPTPFQFVPPTSAPATWTPIIIAPPTAAPTLTLTSTWTPPPTSTPTLTQPPLPTATPTLTSTPTPTATEFILLPPTDTPEPENGSGGTDG